MSITSHGGISSRLALLMVLLASLVFHDCNVELILARIIYESIPMTYTGMVMALLR